MVHILETPPIGTHGHPTIYIQSGAASIYPLHHTTTAMEGDTCQGTIHPDYLGLLHTSLLLYVHLDTNLQLSHPPDGVVLKVMLDNRLIILVNIQPNVLCSLTHHPNLRDIQI